MGSCKATRSASRDSPSAGAPNARSTARVSSTVSSWVLATFAVAKMSPGSSSSSACSRVVLPAPMFPISTTRRSPASTCRRKIGKRSPMGDAVEEQVHGRCDAERPRTQSEERLVHEHLLGASPANGTPRIRSRGPGRGVRPGAANDLSPADSSRTRSTGRADRSGTPGRDHGASRPPCRAIPPACRAPPGRWPSAAGQEAFRVGGGDMALEHVAADRGAVAAAEVVGHAQPLARLGRVVDVRHLDGKPGCLEVVDPGAAAVAVGLLKTSTGGRAAFWPRTGQEDRPAAPTRPVIKVLRCIVFTSSLVACRGAGRHSRRAHACGRLAAARAPSRPGSR